MANSLHQPALNTTVPNECEVMFDQDPWMLEGTAVATLIGGIFSVVMLCIGFISFAAFPRLRRSACNRMILYASVACLVGTVDLLIMALYTLGQWKVISSGVWCSIAAFVLQLSYMNHNGTSLFYVSMLLTSKRGNETAMGWGHVFMAINTVLFLALGVTGWLLVGYQPMCHIPICWVAMDDYGFYFWTRFGLLYLWAALPVLVALIVLGYILYDSWHSRGNGVFRMVGYRGAYALLQVFYWCVFGIDSEDGPYIHSSSGAWVLYLSVAFRSGTAGIQILIFLLTERVWLRWRIRRKGVGDERKEEIRRSLMYSRTRDGSLDLDSIVHDKMVIEQRDPPVIMMIHVALEGLSSSALVGRASDVSLSMNSHYAGGVRYGAAS